MGIARAECFHAGAFESDSMKALIAILGCHSRPEYRHAQRETWIPKIPDQVDWRFFIGAPKADAMFDEVMLDVPDDYESLCLKTKAMMQWAFMHGYDWVYKCDDDTYVRPKLLLESGFDKHQYYGWTEGRSRCSGSAAPRFEWAQGGAGYWVKRSGVELLAKYMIEKEHCEDISAGMTLAQFSITPVHDARYYPECFAAHRENPAPYITLHKCNPQQMREVHQRIEALEC